MRSLAALSRDRSGASVVEFALVAPLFLALILGTVDLGRYLLTMHSLGTLASATARAVIINCGAPPNYGKLNAGCGSATYGLTDAQKQTAAPFLYHTGQISFDTKSTPGQVKIIASLSSPFTFFLPGTSIMPGWSATGEQSLSKPTQTEVLYCSNPDCS